MDSEIAGIYNINNIGSTKKTKERQTTITY